MFFGGTNGWNMFHPDSIIKNIYEPDIVFTRFEIFNKSVVGGPNSPLKKNPV